LQVPLVTRVAQVTGARQVVVPVSQTRPPEQVLPEPQGQPAMSALHAWQTVEVSQYAVPSHLGVVVRQGQLTVPGLHVVGVQVPLVQLRPLLQVSPVLHGQFCAPAGQATHRLFEQISPVLQVLFERQMQPMSPRAQSVQLPDTHSPVVHGALALQSQPNWPGQPPPSSIEGGGLGQPARARASAVNATARVSNGVRGMCLGSI
jgi:hypothetical protein